MATATMNNAQIAGVFEKISGLLGLKGESVFTISAYQRAARTTEHLDSMRFGVAGVRRGWCQERDILNTLPVREFLSFLYRGT